MSVQLSIATNISAIQVAHAPPNRIRIAWLVSSGMDTSTMLTIENPAISAER
jgi:hypothetical protein